MVASASLSLSTRAALRPVVGSERLPSSFRSSATVSLRTSGAGAVRAVFEKGGRVWVVRRV
jgi:hypothetical protein